MAFEHGGRAGKLGDDYERLWGVKQLIRLVTGELKSVVNEPSGDDEAGVDYWVRLASGIREAQQCKGENRNKGIWSFADLNEAKVLGYAKKQLERDKSYRFCFVSGKPAPMLQTMSNFARRSNGDADAFVDMVNKEKTRTRELNRLCGFWKIDLTSGLGRQQVLDLLARMLFRPLDTGPDGIEDVERLAKLTVSGLPREVVACLHKLLQASIGTELYLDAVRDHLKEAGFSPWDLSGDPMVQTRVERLRQRFSKGFGRLLIRGEVIGREETAELLAGLKREDEKQNLWFVHGDAGSGKSGVIFELTRRLEEDGVPFLPIRLDRNRPTVSAEHFGESCGLPASPVNCLKSIAGDRPSVLILDQLDAIRWTSSHSSDAWEVCEELIDDALACSGMSVVVACRTYDMREDPRIAWWKERKKAETVQVGGLSEQQVKQVLQGCGGGWKKLSPQQRIMLKTPHFLYLWWTLYRDTTETPETASSLDLMRTFWGECRRKITELGISGEDLSAVLGLLVEHMDRTGRLLAPAILLDPYPRVRVELGSLDLLQSDDGWGIGFSHQSHFDFLLAERLHREVLQRKRSVLEWIREGDQSLFRREHLRLVLEFQRRSDRRGLVQTLRALFLEEKVRFHLRFLALQFLRVLDTPTSEEVDLLLELLGNEAWGDIVLQQVVLGSAAWFVVLHHKRTLLTWLSSPDEAVVRKALWLMRRVADTHGDAVAELANSFDLSDDTWARRFAHVVPFDPCLDSDALFALRLRLLWDGWTRPDHVSWEQLAKMNSRWSLELLEAYLVALFDHEPPKAVDGKSVRRPSLRLSREELAGLVRAAKAEPKAACDSFFPLILAVVELQEAQSRCGPRGWGLEALLSSRPPKADIANDFERQLMPILLGGVRALARASVDEFFELVDEYSGSRSEVLEHALLQGLAATGPSHSDRAVSWLIASPERFEPIERADTDCRASRALLRKHARHCGPEVYSALEESILSYSNPGERCVFAWHLSSDDYYPNPYGRTQWLLLSALPRRRLSAEAHNRLQAWESKFMDRPTRDTLPTSRSLRVVSGIARDHLSHVSDNEWLRIILEDRPERRGARRQLDKKHVAENSVAQFASDLREISHQQPGRMADFALRIPSDAHPQYLSSVVAGVAYTSPPDTLDEDQKASWEPATQEKLELVIQRVGYTEDDETARSVCRIVRPRFEMEWSDEVLRLLSRFAIEHPDPSPERVSDAEEQGTELLDTSINCVRGQAARAIATVLEQRPEKKELLGPAVESLVEDPALPVRAEAVWLCLAMLNSDRDRAVALALRASAPVDDRILAPKTHLNSFLGYVVRSHGSQVQPLIERMVASDLDEVAQNGAAWLAVFWSWQDQLEALARKCAISERIPHRLGVADVIARRLREGPHLEAQPLLLEFFNDSDKGVRHEASSVFWGKEPVFGLEHMVGLSQAYAKSQALRDDPTHFLRELKNHRGSLIPYAETIFLVCEQFIGPLKEESRSLASSMAGGVGSLVSVILRLYEQSQDLAAGGETQSRCLDMFDSMLRNRVGLMASVVEKLDA